MNAWRLVREAANLTGMQTEHREFFDYLSARVLPPRTVSWSKKGAHERRDRTTVSRARAQPSAITFLATPEEKSSSNTIISLAADIKIAIKIGIIAGRAFPKVTWLVQAHLSVIGPIRVRSRSFYPFSPIALLSRHESCSRPTFWHIQHFWQAMDILEEDNST